MEKEPDWDWLEDLEAKLSEGGSIEPTGELEQRTRSEFPDLGFSEQEIELALSSAEHFTAAILRARRNISQGSRRLTEAFVSTSREEARRIFRAISEADPVRLYRDIATGELEQLGE